MLGPLTPHAIIAIDEDSSTFESIFLLTTFSNVVNANLGDRQEFPFTLSIRFRVLSTRPRTFPYIFHLVRKIFRAQTVCSDDMSVQAPMASEISFSGKKPIAALEVYAH